MPGNITPEEMAAIMQMRAARAQQQGIQARVMRPSGPASAMPPIGPGQASAESRAPSGPAGAAPQPGPGQAAIEARAMPGAGIGQRRGGEVGQAVPYGQARPMQPPSRAEQAKRLREMVQGGKITSAQAGQLMRLFSGGV
jgi:hypothetical protein